VGHLKDKSPLITLATALLAACVAIVVAVIGCWSSQYNTAAVLDNENRLATAQADRADTIATSQAARADRIATAEAERAIALAASGQLQYQRVLTYRPDEPLYVRLVITNTGWGVASTMHIHGVTAGRIEDGPHGSYPYELATPTVRPSGVEFLLIGGDLPPGLTSEVTFTMSAPDVRSQADARALVDRQYFEVCCANCPEQLTVPLDTIYEGFPPTPTPTPLAYTYVVVPGDTLSEIAERYGVSVLAILEENPTITDPRTIYAGMVIYIPGYARPPD
jgi:LysM repeat protein